MDEKEVTSKLDLKIWLTWDCSSVVVSPRRWQNNHAFRFLMENVLSLLILYPDNFFVKCKGRLETFSDKQGKRTFISQHIPDEEVPEDKLRPVSKATKMQTCTLSQEGNEGSWGWELCSQNRLEQEEGWLQEGEAAENTDPGDLLCLRIWRHFRRWWKPCLFLEDYFLPSLKKIASESFPDDSIL